MAKQWDNDTPWPELELLNDGKQFTTLSEVTADIFNSIVNALIYLYYREVL